jgi:hypothetical protein
MARPAFAPAARMSLARPTGSGAVSMWKVTLDEPAST